MSLDIISVATAISNLTVTGLTIADMDEIPQSLNERNTPLLIPDPVTPISGLNIIEWSQGASTMRRDAKYTLNYILIGYPVGQGRNAVIEGFQKTLLLVVAFCNALMAADSLGAAVEWEPTNPRRATNLTNGTTAFHAWNVGVTVTEIL